MERRQQGAEQAGRQDAAGDHGAALALVACRQAGDQQQDGADQDRQAQGGGPMDEQPGAHHRRDAEVRPGRIALRVVPAVVVRVGGHQRDRIAVAGGHVADQPHPGQPAAEDQHGGQHGGASGPTAAQQTARQPVDQQRQRASQSADDVTKAGSRRCPAALAAMAAWKSANQW